MVLDNIDEQRCEVVALRCSSAPEGVHELEEDFFTLVAEGDVCNVRQFLKKHKRSNGASTFNPNCINFENENAMNIAVEQGNTEMITYLSRIMDISRKTILLKAVHKGDVDLVRWLCEQMHADMPAQEGGDKKDSSAGQAEYTADLTPLILAAIEGHFEIIGYLISRGHFIEEPHRPECMCDQLCAPIWRYSDPLDLAIATLHLYSAISNPVYFIYITGDPFHYAFTIQRRLVVLSKFEKPFRCAYEKLARRASRFAACLVSECVNTHEVELVLKQTAAPKKLFDEISQGDYPRLIMAMDYEQKEFLSQPKVQLVVQERFYGSFEDWKYYSNFSKCCYPLLRLFTIPSAYFSFMFYPSSKSAKFYASPINRLLHFLATHFIFLLVLFLENKRDKPCTRDRAMHSFWNIVIFIYFTGLAATAFHQFLHYGHKRFLKFKWNAYDLVMLSIYAASLAFEVSSIVHAKKLKRSPHLERKYWASLDPQLMSEGFAVVANVMAYMRLLFFSQVHKVIGPLQVGLFRMVKNFVCYSVFGIALILAYTTAFSNFYSYYSGMVFTDPSCKDKFTQEESFIDWLSTFKTFFWGTFGHAEPEVADVVIENSRIKKSKCIGGEFHNQHLFTQFVGYVALGSFALLVIMIVKNMLVATMVKVYEELMDDFHRSWLVKRMEIFVYFFTSPVMPPPFNLFPHVYSKRTVLEKVDLETACKDEGYDLECDYLKLARILVLRYFNRMNKDKECEEKFPLHTECGVPIATPKTRCRSL